MMKLYNPWIIQKMIDNVWYMMNENGVPINIIPPINNTPWIISDTHFNHLKIQEYCDRPDGWQELIIKNWNNAIGYDDVVLHLGDFAFGNKETTNMISSRLNGNIYMIRGNHDRHGKQWYKDVGITVVPSFMTKIEGTSDTLYFTHRPIRNKMDGINIHGHMHQNAWFINGNFVNVSVEVTNYKPVKLHDILKGVGNDITRITESSSDT